MQNVVTILNNHEFLWFKYSLVFDLIVSSVLLSSQLFNLHLSTGKHGYLSTLLTLIRAEQMVSHFYRVHVHGIDPVGVSPWRAQHHLFSPAQRWRQYCSVFWHSRNIFQNEHVSGRVAPEDRQRAEKRHCTSMWVMCPVSAIDHSPRNTQISNTYSYPLIAPENKGKIATKSLVRLNENLNWIDLCAFQCGTLGVGGGCLSLLWSADESASKLAASQYHRRVNFSTHQGPFPLPQKQPAYEPHFHSLPLFILHFLSLLLNIKD